MSEIKSFKSKEPIGINFLNPPVNLFEEGVESLKEEERFYCPCNEQYYTICDGRPVNEECALFLQTLKHSIQALGKTFDECIEITEKE